MAEQQRRQCECVPCNNANYEKSLTHFLVEGQATDKQLGSGSYGSVEEVKHKPEIILTDTDNYYGLNYCLVFRLK